MKMQKMAGMDTASTKRKHQPCEMQTQQLVYQKQEFPPTELPISAATRCESKDQKISCGVLADLQCEDAFVLAILVTREYLQ
jgi:hypothetical protein